MARSVLGGYKSYAFKDHDPILDQIDRLYELSSNAYGTGPMSMAQVENKSGVTASTLRNWRDRKTRRPQFATVKAVAKALGADLAIVYQGRPINTRRSD